MDNPEEQKEKEILKKTLSYYNKMPTATDLDTIEQKGEKKAPRRDFRTIVISIITTIVTIAVIVLAINYFK